MPKRDFYLKDSELDEYQIKVVQRRSDKSFIVRGCAGSGKSILALWKVKQIQDEDRGSYYFILFTKTLKQYMQDGIDSIGLESDRVLYFQEWKNTRSAPSADYIIVDEAQDFSEDDLKLFQSKANNALILYGDSAQQIYSFRKSNPPISMEDIAYLTKFPDERLIFNHRLTKKIARFAESFLSEEDELEQRCRVEGTELPKILYYPSLHSQFDTIIEIIKNRQLEDVGILFRTNAEVDYAQRYFREHGLDVEWKSNETMDLDFTSTKPKLTTYHSSKGLQYEAVFIPNCDQEFDDTRPLYVAITRSYNMLFMMHSGLLSSVFEAIPVDQYETSLVKASGVRL